MRDWLRVYLYDNLFLYRGSGNLFVRLGKTLLYILGTLGANVQYNFFVLLGVVGFARKRGKERAEEKAFLLIVPAVTAFFLYIGGRGYRYYGLPLAIFAVCGYAFLAERGFGIRGPGEKGVGPRGRARVLSAVYGDQRQFYLFVQGKGGYRAVSVCGGHQRKGKFHAAQLRLSRRRLLSGGGKGARILSISVR